MSGPAVVTETPATPVTPDAAPVAAPVAPATPQTPPERLQREVPAPEQLLSRREAKQGLVDSFKTEAAPEATPPTPEVPAAGASPVAPQVPLGAPAVSQPIVVQVPEGHPLREMGITEFQARTPQEERGLRASINTWVRRAENDALKSRLQAMEQERATLEARQAAHQRWTARPEYETASQRYQELKDAFGDEVANDYWRGVNTQFEALAQAELDQRVQALRTQEISQAAQGWKGEAWMNVSTLPAPVRTLPQFTQWFEDAVHSFNAEIELGHYPQVENSEQMHRAFMQFFSARLTSRPEVIAVYKSVGERYAHQQATAASEAAARQAEIDRIKQEAVEDYKRTHPIAAGRPQAPPHPLGSVGAAGHDRMPLEEPVAAPEVAAASPHELRRLARQGAQDDARRRMAGT